MKTITRAISIAVIFFHFSINAQTIVDVVVNSPDHNTLETAVLAAGLETALSSEGPFTLFAPTDAAFEAIDEDVLNSLLADPSGDLTNILLYHAVNGVASTENIFDGLVISNLLGQNITFTINDSGAFINGANISVVDIKTTNGIVHVIDAVLLPEPVEEISDGTVLDVVVNSPDHNTLETAVLAAGLEGALASEGPFTVFAPTDDAFGAIGAETLDALLADPSGALTDILLYHVVNGVASSDNIFDGLRISSLLGQNITISVNENGVFINDAQVTVADIKTSNGVVHVIDAVLLPEPAPESVGTIVDVIVNSPDHNTLEAAVLAAGLDGALSGEGPFTVFAPTDDAFAAIDPDVLNSLLEDPTGALTDILLYHAITGVASTQNIFDGMSLSTLSGQHLTVSINDNGVFINDAQVTVADIQTSNGIIHVIDAVLIP